MNPFFSTFLSKKSFLTFFFVQILLSACTTSHQTKHYVTLQSVEQSQQLVLYSLGLLGTSYRFGGKNPDAGMDCSGMVSYIVAQVSGKQLPHNASAIASITRPIKRKDLQPGDFIFFNTGHRHSHMGIYIGQGTFVHAPSSGSYIRRSSLNNPYFKKRIDGLTTMRP